MRQLLEYLDRSWVVKGLGAFAPTGKPGQIPKDKRTLQVIRAHEVIRMLFESHSAFAPLLQGRAKNIPITASLTELLLLARDVRILVDNLPATFSAYMKTHYLSARQELFVGAAHRTVTNEVGIAKRLNEADNYDIRALTVDKHALSLECKRRIGRDDERQATHAVVASFTPRMIEALESAGLNYAVLIKANETPKEAILVKEIPKIVEAIKQGKSELHFDEGRYRAALRKLCDPGGGISDTTLAEIYRTYSFGMSVASPPSSPILVTPAYYKYYNPYIAGIGLDRLQQDSRDYVQRALKKANKQLATKEQGWGIVYFEENDAGATQLKRTIARVSGDAAAYGNIDAVVFYYTEAGISEAARQADVRPTLRIISESWVRTPAVKKINGIPGLTTDFNGYMKTCPFDLTKDDVDYMGKVYKDAGLS